MGSVADCLNKTYYLAYIEKGNYCPFSKVTGFKKACKIAEMINRDKNISLYAEINILTKFNDKYYLFVNHNEEMIRISNPEIKGMRKMEAQRLGDYKKIITNQIKFTDILKKYDL